MRKNIGLRLSQARKAKGLTQEQLASASEEEQKVVTYMQRFARLILEIIAETEWGDCCNSEI